MSTNLYTVTDAALVTATHRYEHGESFPQCLATAEMLNDTLPVMYVVTCSALATPEKTYYRGALIPACLLSGPELTQFLADGSLAAT